MRAVRQRCGFGCVVCGSAIVQYHHFDPEFVNAKTHLAKGITLLCGRCHDKVKQAGVDEIRRHDASPFCKRRGFAHDFLFASRDKIRFQIGSAVFKRHAVVLYDNEVLVGFAAPIEKGEPLRLYAKLKDDQGNRLLEIVENILVVGADLFDVDTSGNALTIRRGLARKNHRGLNEGAGSASDRL